MTVHELITQLQECDKPDADVQVLIFDSKPMPTVADVYYESIESNAVIIEVTK